MSSSFVEDGAFVNSIVGEGTRFNGELDLNGLLRIDGDFTGSIRTSGKVLVGKNGRAQCTIKASTVVIGGAVRGDIYSSEKVIVLSSGIILGNIFSPRLIVEEGVILSGNCTITNSYDKKSEKIPGKAVSESDSPAEDETQAASLPESGNKEADPDEYDDELSSRLHNNASRVVV
jgi:cytoskeletal protein CcmA (bactofilin family)